MNEIVSVEIHAELRQMKSMADHTYNVVLNVSEDCLEQVRIMMGWLGDEISIVLVDEKPSRKLPALEH